MMSNHQERQCLNNLYFLWDLQKVGNLYQLAVREIH
jgi:hypothetical protein